MMKRTAWRRARRLAAPILIGPAAALSAQAPPPVATSGTQTYVPADFARFSPRNALDMLNNVPGFAIDEGDTERRGLGQATGNVLINGQRFSGKTTDIFTELSRISAANVARIEIVDGATLNVSGLAGRVANVITLSRGLSGNYAWRPQIRAHRTPARLTNGEISINGTLGGSQYTLSLANDGFRNGNAGPERAFRPDGTLLDLRDEVLSVNGDEPRLSGTLRHDFADGSILNLNGAFQYEYQNVVERSARHGAGQPDRDQRIDERTREVNYELGGDYEFPLGGGRLKLIGLTRFEHEPFSQTRVLTFADATPTQGERFAQVGDTIETIARGEYRWRAGGADWQTSIEGALNQLEVANRLFSRDPANGAFVPVPLPDAAATVREQRAEAALTYGRPLSSRLTLQASLAAEYSRLTQESANGLSRTFYRPKGFVSLAWRPRPGLDISARIEREVGQLNFFDFVASANVSAGTTNAGNANLVPPQSWAAQVQATRTLGRWGTASLRLFGKLTRDVVDIIPIGANGQSPGNLPGTARTYGAQWTSTFNFDPIGLAGAKLDMNLQVQKTSLVDPLTAARRPFSAVMTRQLDINFRHDPPRTNYAYGVSFSQYRESPAFRLDQISQFLDTPGSLGVFVERKNLHGLTLRLSADNLLGTNESFRREYYDGARTRPLLFTEARDRFYGPIFTLSISGTL